MSGNSLTLNNYDDLNLAEASLISCLTRLRKGETSWEHSFVIAGREMHVECLGNKHGYPHGPDNDMMLLLTNLYLEQGKPANNSIECTAYGLLKMLGRTDSSANYRIIHDSLNRLSGTLYKISGWLDHPGGTVRRVTFRFIDRIEEIQGEAKALNLKSFGAGTLLRITLDKEVAASLSSPRVRPFDLEFMLKLPGSQARTLFRLLDTLWYTDPQAAQGFLEFDLTELAKLLRLQNSRPDSIRRTIVPIHEELVVSEFLKQVEFHGRGRTQRVRYFINPQRPDYPLTVEQLELVGRIKKLDVPDVQARMYVRKHPLQRAAERVELAERILATTKTFHKGRGAYAWDILTDEAGKYALTAPRKDVRASQGSFAARPAFQVRQGASAPSEAEVPDEALTFEEQWNRCSLGLSFLMRPHLAPHELRELERRCLSGEISAASFFREAAQAKASGSLEVFLEDFRKVLG